VTETVFTCGAPALTAPEAFRCTFGAAPERHLRAAEHLGGAMDRPDDDRDHLPRTVAALTRDVDIPNGLTAIRTGSMELR
jgi:hydroxyacid-oxoacid transhydrogenase